MSGKNNSLLLISVIITLSMNVQAVESPATLADPFLSGAGGAGGVDEIVGGEPVQQGAYPWMAGLLLSNSLDNLFLAQFCGGMLIEPSWILTAAHCVYSDFTFTRVYDPLELTVLLNQVDLEGEGGELITVERIVVHPDFDALNLQNDIALLRLSSPSVQEPLGLAPVDDSLVTAPNTIATVLGWGAMTTDLFPDFPTNLQQAQIPIVSNTDCKQFWDEDPFSQALINDTHLCAGFVRGEEIDTCSGDSGGPLLVHNNQGKLVVAGITSFGTSECASGVPGVYTRTSKFLDWIEDGRFLDLSFVQYANGAGLSSDILLYNPSTTSAAEGQLYFWNEDGSLATGPTSFQIAPRGAFSLEGSSAGNLVLGSVSVQTELLLSGVVRFNLAGQGIAGVGLNCSPAKSILAPVHFRNGVRTGLAVRATPETGSNGVAVRITLNDSVGTPRGTIDQVLLPNSRIAQFIDEIFPGIAMGDFLGTVVVEVVGGGEVSAVALELGTQPGQFTTLPVTVLE